MDTNVGQAGAALRALLVCGVAASALRFATDRVAGTRSNGYSFIHQSISELTAVGAPTRSWIVPIELAWGLLMIAFGVGVWRMAAESTALRVAAFMLLGNAVTTLVVAAFVPARCGGMPSTNTSTANIILGATGMVFFVLAMAFGGAAFHGWFRILSFGVLIAFVVLTVVGLVAGGGSAPSGDMRPATGAQERTMMYSYLLWVAALTAVLLGAGVAAPPE